MHLCPRQYEFCRRLGAFAMHISMALLLMFLSPPLRGVGPMALMLGHEWQHIYLYIHEKTIRQQIRMPHRPCHFDRKVLFLFNRLQLADRRCAITAGSFMQIIATFIDRSS
jgi:hypothetical protein